MGLPAPSPEQEAALTALKDVALAGASATVGKVAAIQGALDAQQEVEDFQKETFDVLNDNIIGKYETERRWLDGQDIVGKIVEADVQQFAASGQGRLDNGGDFSPLRIAQFDGGPLTDEEPGLNELDLFDGQDVILTLLQTGFPGQVTLDNGANIKDAIDGASTTVNILDNLQNINPNDVLFVSGGGNSGFLKVLTASVGGNCVGEDTPPQLTEAACVLDNGTWTVEDSITFEWLLAPSGSIPALSDIGQKTFGGFTDLERTNQTASDSDFQGLMDSQLANLVTNFNNRKTALNNQIATNDTNEDDNLDANAKINSNASITAINGLLGVSAPGTMDVSDSGIVAINAEKDIRKPQVTQRVIDALAAGAVYYDQRFNTTEGRCRLNNGSIVLVNDLTKAKVDVVAGGAEAAALAGRYDDLL